MYDTREKPGTHSGKQTSKIDLIYVMWFTEGDFLCVSLGIPLIVTVWYWRCIPIWGEGHSGNPGQDAVKAAGHNSLKTEEEDIRLLATP